MIHLLTDAKIKALKPLPAKGYKRGDGGGLQIFVSPSGTKSWRYKYRLSGKENLFSLGQYPEVGLAEARSQLAKAKALVVQGIHPLTKKISEKLNTSAKNESTFKVVAESWLQTKVGNCSPYYCRQIETALIKDVLPAIGALPIQDVKPLHVLELLKKVEKRGAPVLARQIKQWCTAVFNFAIVNLKCEHDPTTALKGAIVRPKVKHNLALNQGQIEDLLIRMRDFSPYRTTAIAIELLMHTFVRTVELRKAEWSEFDLDLGEWKIPAERMKMKIAHTVPLSLQTKKLLQELRGITGAAKHLFPNNRRPDSVMTPTTINQVLKRLGVSGKGSIGFSAHGFRGTAATILYEKKFRTEVIEKQLSHAERNQVKASYNQAQYMEERRVMMQIWSDYIDERRPKVNSAEFVQSVQSPGTGLSPIVVFEDSSASV